MQTRKLLSLILAIVILLSTVPAISSGAVAYTRSGYTDLNGLTKAQVVALTRDAYLRDSQNPYVTIPSVTAPYTLGQVRDDFQQAALDRLNSYRILAGLDTITLNTEQTKYAQAASVVNATNNKMTHYPAQPSDMPDDFFSDGYYGAGRSNIACYMGYRPATGALCFSVDMWMEDSDQSNIDRLGHRRWVLNPTMSATGFGCATSADGWLHTAMYAFDTAARARDYEHISWPPSGYMVNDTPFFTTDYAWSVSVNPAKYNTSYLKNVTVTVTNELGRRWTFSSANADGYFNVDLGGYGAPRNAIIFRPSAVLKYDGVYTVTISGLVDYRGQATSLAYQVEFFDSDDTDITETTTEAPTTEAPTTEAPTTEAPTTEAPTTEAPTTEAPTTEAPTTEAPTTEAPTTEAPTTEAPTTEAPTTEAPTTEAPTTEAPTTEAPTTEAPTTEAPTTEVPTTEAPTTEAPTTEVPTTEAPTTEAPTTEAPTTEAPTTEAPAPVMLGDVTGDTRITASDARAALRFAAKLDVPDAIQFRAADVNRDGKLNATDARLILRVAAKLDEFKQEDASEATTEPANETTAEAEENSTAAEITTAEPSEATTEEATAEKVTEAETTTEKDPLFSAQIVSTTAAEVTTEAETEITTEAETEQTTAEDKTEEATTKPATEEESTTKIQEPATSQNNEKPQPEDDDLAVVITVADGVYHDLECDILLYDDGEILALPMSEAEKKGYTKCNHCLK